MSEFSETPDFEQALVQLEQLVRQLEAGDLSLEQSLKCYEQGVHLIASCEKVLEQAEQRIAVLSENIAGDVERKQITQTELDGPAS
ncbi:MAG: exodeoxyribonuclease VII small subunit [Gammaproteobacteria bacterium]